MRTTPTTEELIDAVKSCMESAHSDGKYGMEESAATHLLFHMFMQKLQGLLAQSEQMPAATVEMCNSTTKPHVGDSAFEDWFQVQPFALQSGIKQISRDSYAAGMGDSLVNHATHPAPIAADVMTDDEIRQVAFNDCSEDWNSLEAKESWLGGYVSGATAMQKYMRAKK